MPFSRSYKCRKEEVIPFILNKFKSAFVAHFTKLDEEAKNRSAEFSYGTTLGKFPIASVFVVALGAAFATFWLVTPQKWIVKSIEENPAEFFLIRKGKIHFSENRAPKNQPEGQFYQISLPFLDTINLPGYSQLGIWYEFEIKVPPEKLNNGNLGMLVPKIWGASKIFLDDSLVDYGVNFRPILIITKPLHILKIFADLSDSKNKNPISAHYPIVVGDIGKIRSLNSALDEEAQLGFRAHLTYGIVILIFGMLFLAYPKKPELAAFVIFLGISLGTTYAISLHDKNYLFLGTPEVQGLSLVFFEFLTNLALHVFSMLYFRATPSSVKASTISIIVFYFFIGTTSTILAAKFLRARDFVQPGSLVTNSIFLIANVYFVLPRLAYLFRIRQIPLTRKIVGALIFGSATIVTLLNVIDYFFMFVAPTTTLSNGLLINISLAIAVAYEISRAEMKQLIFGSLLPTEVKESWHIKGKGVSQQAFVLLVDAIGFAAKREKFNDLDSREKLVEQLAISILKPVHEMQIESFSILSCTGDGLYCAIRGEASRKNFIQSVSLAKKIIQSKDSSNVSSIQFRAAIGYGEYGVKIIEYGKIRKEFVAGNVMNDLSRIIGSGREPCSLRILAGKEINQLCRDSSTKSLMDKHGFEHCFFEWDDENAA